MTDLAECASLGVRELQPTIQLRLEDAVLGVQIFVPRQQLLVHGPCHVGKDARPIHYGPLMVHLGDGVTHRPQDRAGPRHDPRSGPDLARPMNPVDYSQPTALRKFLRDLRSVRAWPDQKMPAFSEERLPDSDIDAIVAWLAYKAGKR